MTKLVRFNAPFFDGGVPKYFAGKHYPISEETLRCAAAGTAEVVDVDIAVDEAEKLAERARRMAEAAAAKAEEARLLADAARAAQAEADQAASIIAGAADEEAKVRLAEEAAAAARAKQEEAKKLLAEEVAKRTAAGESVVVAKDPLDALKALEQGGSEAASKP